MRKYIVFFYLLFIVSIDVFAQSCYTNFYNKGKILYASGKYQEAINYFEEAKKCPDKPSNNDIQKRIGDCKNKLNPVPQVNSDFYLSVSSSDLFYPASGGTKTISINTNSNTWTYSPVYHWIHLYKNGNNLEIRCDANNETSERKDNFVISIGNKSQTIYLTQQGKLNTASKETTSTISDINASATIHSVWASHDVWDYDKDNKYVKGMRIHVKFDVSGMLNADGTAVVYFYNNEGTPIYDTNGRYGTSTNTACASTNFKAKYQNTSYSDMTIFMPYNELHITNSGTTKCKLFISIWDRSKATSNSLSQSNWYYFDYLGSVNTSSNFSQFYLGTAKPTAYQEWVDYNGTAAVNWFVMKSALGTHFTFGMEAFAFRLGPVEISLLSGQFSECFYDIESKFKYNPSIRFFIPWNDDSSFWFGGGPEFVYETYFGHSYISGFGEIGIRYNWGNSAYSDFFINGSPGSLNVGVSIGFGTSYW